MAAADGERGWELEHVWVLPAYMRQGEGRSLLAAILRRLETVGAAHLRVVSDRHAVGFYERLGATIVGEVESLPAGRRRPVLSLTVGSPAE
jgi:ribosomal protein S18 acetylase RimI-like enzyme